MLRRIYFRVERKKGGQVAKVATARKLLEWIYHTFKDSMTYEEMESITEYLGEVILVIRLAVHNRPVNLIGEPQPERHGAAMKLRRDE